jgi:hypothetical protein
MNVDIFIHDGEPLNQNRGVGELEWNTGFAVPYQNDLTGTKVNNVEMTSSLGCDGCNALLAKLFLVGNKLFLVGKRGKNGA